MEDSLQLNRACTDRGSRFLKPFLSSLLSHRLRKLYRIAGYLWPIWSWSCFQNLVYRFLEWIYNREKISRKNLGWKQEVRSNDFFDLQLRINLNIRRGYLSAWSIKNYQFSISYLFQLFRKKEEGMDWNLSYLFNCIGSQWNDDERGKWTVYHFTTS